MINDFFGASVFDGISILHDKDGIRHVRGKGHIMCDDDDGRVRAADNEAEINAENNYMWPEAVEVAKAHKAHIMVAVLGEEEKLLERGKLFTKAMAVCCKQKYATGVYTSGVVFEPRFYEGLAYMIKEDELPIFNWIWFGLYRSEGVKI